LIPVARIDDKRVRVPPTGPASPRDRQALQQINNEILAALHRNLKRLTPSDPSAEGP
jgi:hypothetical protein